MALSRVNVVPLTKSGDAFGTGVYTPASFTPGAGVRLEIKLWAMSNSNDALAGSDLSIAITGLTFDVLHQTDSADSVGWGYAMKAWLSSTTPSGALSVSFDAGAFNIQNYWYQVDAVTGEDSGDPLGAIAKGTDADGEGAFAITLDAAPATTSTVVAMLTVAHDNTVGTIDPGSGWVEEGDSPRNGWANVQSQHRDSSTSTTVDWTDINNGGSTPLGAAGMAYEIKAAGGGAFVLVASGPIALHGVLGISGDFGVEVDIPVEPVAPIALHGTLGITGDIAFEVLAWRIPTNAPAGTEVHVTILNGSGNTYTEITQGRTTVNADGHIYFPAQGAIGVKLLAFVHNYDDNTETTSIFGGPCIAQIVDIG